MDSTGPSSVAILLLNWNGFDFTRACLTSLNRIRYPNYEIIVVDNGSGDGSYLKLKERFPDIPILRSDRNLGFTGGNNLGMEYALAKNFDFILLLNNDTLVNPDFLSNLVRSMELNPQAGAIQPLIYKLEEKEKIWNAGGKFVHWLGVSRTCYRPQNMDTPYPTDWITGCAFMVRSTVIRQVGLLHDIYFAYFEDVDWSLRMNKAGYQLLVEPKAIIYHEAGASSKTQVAGEEGFLSPRVHYLNARNQIIQLRKYASFPYAMTAWPYHIGKFGVICIYFILKNRRKKLRAILRGIKDGIKATVVEKV